MNSTKKTSILAFCSALLFVSVLIVSCSSPKTVINKGSDGIAIKGYDTVAYFIIGKPVKGEEQFAYEWNGGKWLFSNREHLDLFVSDPKQYAPQYGGY